MEKESTPCELCDESGSVRMMRGCSGKTEVIDCPKCAKEKESGLQDRYNDLLDALKKITAIDRGSSIVFAQQIAKAAIENKRIPNELLMNREYFKFETFYPNGTSGFVVRSPTAVRVTHIPTGMTAEYSRSRSLFENKAEAFSIIKDMLLRRQPESNIQ